MRRWLLVSGFIAIVCTIILLVVGVATTNYFRQNGPLTHKTSLVVAKGSSFKAITAQLSDHNIIRNPWLFYWHLRVRGYGQNLQAGEYAFEPYITPGQVFSKLSRGETITYNLTIPEGLMTDEVLTRVMAEPHLDKTIMAMPSEGSLLPETYSFSRSDDRNALILRMQNAMKIVLEERWGQRHPDLPLKTPQEALVLASIVEKETGLAKERPRVAAVLVNRLRKGMKLQSDPTVRYGLGLSGITGEIPRGLTRDDLDKPSPYNTYLNEGLPPTPICNPGRASISAVLNPKETEDLFFVADGSGGHIFSKTYQEHARHHKNWRKIRKKKDAKEGRG